MRFIFIRHGETDWNKAGMMQGSKDIPLNATGLVQASAAAQHLKNHSITKIVTSPQDRARKTAEIIAEVCATVLHLEPDLRERHFGKYEGFAWEDVPRVSLHADGKQGPFDYPEGGAEPFDELTTRSKGAIERWLHAHRDDLILFVAHGGVFSALNHALDAGAGSRIENAKPYEFRRGADGKWICLPL